MVQLRQNAYRFHLAGQLLLAAKHRPANLLSLVVANSSKSKKWVIFRTILNLLLLFWFWAVFVALNSL